MKWEYKVESISDWHSKETTKNLIEDLCDKMDKEGWELVSSHGSGDYSYLIFRRER